MHEAAAGKPHDVGPDPAGTRHPPRQHRAPSVDAPPDDECARIGHEYLSTACVHGRHEHCDAMVGSQGAKRPATCKWGGASCVCPRHRDPQAPCGAGSWVCGASQPGTLPYWCSLPADHDGGHAAVVDGRTADSWPRR